MKFSDLFDKIKDTVSYDADRDFYARVFPGSVERKDLLRMRKMWETDLPAVLAIEQQVYNYPWSEGIFHDCFKARYSCWVCDELDKVLGYCIVSTAAGEFHIMNICVDPAEQKQGIGKFMLEHIVEQAKSRWAESIFLEVRPTNEAAIALYTSMGFNEIGIRKDYYPSEDGREDAVMLALALPKKE